MTIEVPLWLQGGTYPARLDRALIAASMDEGSREGLKVSQRGAGANMTVDVSIGSCVIQGDDQANQGNYIAVSTAVENLTGFVAASSTQRIDLVCMRINDPNAGGPAGSTATLIRVAGAESGSPVAPAVPTSAIALAQVGPFTTSTSSIINSMITDLRTQAGRKLHVGAMEFFAASVAPNGWLFCDGSAISRSTFARLFEVISTSYGVGDGSTTFNLPDFRGRSPVGLSNMGTAAGNASGNARVQATVGSSGGEVLHTLTTAELAAHAHSADHDHPSNTSATEGSDHAHTGPSHTHNSTVRYNQVEVQAGTGAFIQQVGTSGGSTHVEATSAAGNAITTGVTATHTHTVDLPNLPVTSGSVGSGTAHNVTHPYAGAYVLIRT